MSDWSWEPPPKPERWLFAPTALMGALAVVLGGGTLVGGLALGRDWAIPWPIAIIALLVGVAMLVVGVWAVTYRVRIGIGEGHVEIARTSWVRSSTDRHPLGAFDRVELVGVAAAQNAHQPNPVGAYTMIWLAGAERVHLASLRPDEADAVAEQIAGASGLPISRA